MPAWYSRATLVSAAFASPLEAQRAGIATIYQELLLFPELTVAENIFMGHAPRAALGRLDWRAMHARAAELLQLHKTVQTLGVTCNPQSVLEKLCTHTFKLDWADEKSTVMTRSFTAILLAFQRLGLQFVSDNHLSTALDELPRKGQTWLDAQARKIQDFAGKRKFSDYVFLGQGVHYWLAQEAGLKVMEMSSSYSQVYHSLEFRHGPRSIAGPETLITFYMSDAASAAWSAISSAVRTKL